MAQAKATKKKRGRPPKKRTALQGGSKIPVERLQLVEKRMAEAWPRRNIVKEAMEAFKVTEATAYKYYDIVEREWLDEEKPRRSYQRTKAVKELERCIQGAMGDRKWASAVRAIVAKAKLLGLNEPDEVIVHTPDSHPVEAMTSAQLRAYMKEEHEKIAQLREQVLTERSAVVH